MKIILTTTLLLFTNYTFSQVKFDYLKLEDNQVIFECIYDIDSLSASEIEKVLISTVPSLKNVVNFNNNQSIITAKIKSDKIDYKRYGGKTMTASTFLAWDMDGNVSIVWKDSKYKVTVSNITFTFMNIFTGGSQSMTITDIFTKKNGAEMRTNTKLQESGNYVQQHLVDLFKLNKLKKEW